jgi:hypothetical protein
MIEHPSQITCACGQPAYHYGDYKTIPIVCIFRCPDNHVTERKFMTIQDYFFTEEDIQAIAESLTVTDCDEDAMLVWEIWQQYRDDVFRMKDQDAALQKFHGALRPIIKGYEDNICGLRDDIGDPHKICILVGSCTCNPIGLGFDDMGHPQ